jgi:hypothetical protein
MLLVPTECCSDAYDCSRNNGSPKIGTTGFYGGIPPCCFIVEAMCAPRSLCFFFHIIRLYIIHAARESDCQDLLRDQMVSANSVLKISQRVSQPLVSRTWMSPVFPIVECRRTFAIPHTWMSPVFSRFLNVPERSQPPPPPPPPLYRNSGPSNPPLLPISPRPFPSP